jgi:hypothetical protein
MPDASASINSGRQIYRANASGSVVRRHYR